MFGRPTLFKQTLLAFIGTLFLVHLVVTLAIVAISPRGVDAISIGDVTKQLARSECRGGQLSSEFAVPVEAHLQTRPPELPKHMATDRYLTEQLAAALDVSVDDVRLFWRRGSDIRLNRPVEVTVQGKVSRLDQTIFPGGSVFGRRTAEGWCVRSVKGARISENWRWGAAYLTLLSLLATMPLAWIFARRLSRPIREFASAADRIGRDSDAPLLEETGPEELRIATRALNEMQRGIQQQLRHREAMIAAIAHDLRTPLSRIAFRVESLPAEVRDPVQRDVGQMKAMIAATIEYSRGLDGDKGEDPVDLAALLTRLVEDEQALGSDIGSAIEPGPAVVRGKEVEFGRLFQNLIDNARAFGGAVEVGLIIHGDVLLATVADRGPGIPADRREAIFTPFVRGEPSRNAETGGVGLGLPIARTIARRYGGELELLDRPGGGLIAAVKIPVDREQQDWPGAN